MLSRDNAVLVVVDVQGKLSALMHKHEAMLKNIITVVKGARQLSLPVLWMEQLPDKLGPTTPLLAAELEGVKAMSKSTFSACGHQGFLDELGHSGREQVLLVGIETHICVYQTALDLQERGFEVEVVADATSSRAKRNKRLALDKLAQAGVGLTSVEMMLFELMRTAECEEFRSVTRLIK